MKGRVMGVQVSIPVGKEIDDVRKHLDPLAATPPIIQVLPQGRFLQYDNITDESDFMVKALELDLSSARL